MSAPAIALDEVEVKVGRKTLLGPISLTVRAGEHVLIVGPSGCGKTTLLRAVAGLAQPCHGRVALFGELAHEGRKVVVSPARRNVGMLFQNGALWPHMSVRKTLNFVMKQAKVPAAERKQRSARLLELVELTGKEKRKPGTLSGGEAQRLAIARALAGQPRILLLDEPLGPLDAELRSDLLDRLAAVQAELELTVLHVTHDPAEAERVAGRTLRLEAGHLTQEHHHE